MLTDHQIQMGYDIAEKLTDCWLLRFSRSAPPASDILLGCGVVLALMRLQAEEKTKSPFFSHSEVSELVGYALALPELENLTRERLSDDLVRICVLFRIAHVGYHGFTLGDEFFIRYLGWATCNS
ncbi:hypothetical protein [Escherichia coli]|uniref:hypothetical protein n=1 Tax=Escherichia coli TaxID=562 RepID=UPI001A8E5C3D|nr:hypothetical protein [Escherichia coli]MBO0269356.1 hypothetical protein [Escherichia coli]